MPTVSILMTAYNSGRHIGATIESVVAQTFTDFELVVIDDASNDQTSQILQEWVARDRRIRVFRNERNMGVCRSLNRGLDLIEGDLLARLDSDDISVPHRLERQVDFFRRNPDIGICGANVISIDESGVPFTGPWFTKSTVPIEWRLIWESTYAASTVTLRSELFLRTGYRYREIPAEDSDIVRRLAAITRAVRLDEVLVHYRVRRDSLFHSHPEKHYRQALLSSAELAEVITGRSVPGFHPWLTRHWRDLNEPTGAVVLHDVSRWLCDLLDMSTKRWHWRDSERQAAMQDAQERLNQFASVVDSRVIYVDYSAALLELGGRPRGRTCLAVSRLFGRILSERRTARMKLGIKLLFTDPAQLLKRIKRLMFH